MMVNVHKSLTLPVLKLLYYQMGETSPSAVKVNHQLQKQQYARPDQTSFQVNVLKSTSDTGTHGNIRKKALLFHIPCFMLS